MEILITTLIISNIFWIIYGLFIKDKIQDGYIKRIENLEAIEEHLAESLDEHELRMDGFERKYFIIKIDKDEITSEVIKRIYGNGTT